MYVRKLERSLTAKQIKDQAKNSLTAIKLERSLTAETNLRPRQNILTI
jgi:hypothetical protein